MDPKGPVLFLDVVERAFVPFSRPTAEAIDEDHCDVQPASRKRLNATGVMHPRGLETAFEFIENVGTCRTAGGAVWQAHRRLMPPAFRLPAIPEGRFETLPERLVWILSRSEDEIQASMIIALPAHGPAPSHGMIDSGGVEGVVAVANIVHDQFLVSREWTQGRRKPDEISKYLGVDRVRERRPEKGVSV